MIKFRHFVFTSAMVVLILLGMGNLTTLAQANNIDIVTTTPTGTPFTDPNGRGEPVPEELKAVIQAYFEIRYRAFSVSDSDDFKQSGFGDVLSDVPEAGAFLQEELGKLAVEIKHAELNHLRYAKYKYFLDFRNVVVDASGQMATVAVVEDNEVIYELSAELTPEEPIISNHANFEHTIVLRKQQDQWRIVSYHYNDYLWRMLRRTGKSTEEMLNMLNTMNASPVPAANSENAEIMTASPLPDDTSMHAYDRIGAVNYALQWWDGYNPDYPIYDG